MKWPDRVQAIVEALAAAHRDLQFGDDVARRRLTMLFAEQCCFELGSNWGTKRADPGRPLSADVICTRDPFVGWDTQIAGGVIAQFPESIDLAGQVFVPVEPANHLGAGEPASPPPASADLAARLEAIEQILARMDGALATQAQLLAALLTKPGSAGSLAEVIARLDDVQDTVSAIAAAPWPTYRSTSVFGTTTNTPTPKSVTPHPPGTGS